MATWNVSAKLSAALFVVGDRRLDIDEIVDWRLESRNGDAVGNFFDEVLGRVRGE